MLIYKGLLLEAFWSIKHMIIIKNKQYIGVIVNKLFWQQFTSSEHKHGIIYATQSQNLKA